MCCLYFGSSRERFALLKSPRMIKTESGCFCSVSVIWSASFCKAELTVRLRRNVDPRQVERLEVKPFQDLNSTSSLTQLHLYT